MTSFSLRKESQQNDFELVACYSLHIAHNVSVTCKASYYKREGEQGKIHYDVCLNDEGTFTETDRQREETCKHVSWWILHNK